MQSWVRSHPLGLGGLISNIHWRQNLSPESISTQKFVREVWIHNPGRLGTSWCYINSKDKTEICQPVSWLQICPWEVNKGPEISLYSLMNRQWIQKGLLPLGGHARLWWPKLQHVSQVFSPGLSNCLWSQREARSISNKSSQVMYLLKWELFCINLYTFPLRKLFKRMACETREDMMQV